MNDLNLTPLLNNELSFLSQASDLHFVIRGKNLLSIKSAEDVMSYFKDQSEVIKHLVRKNGVLLFRNLPLNSATHFEQALEALDYDLFQSNYGSASPRSHVTRKTFVSTLAPSPFIIGLHTEFCYQSTRPCMISFFCVKPAAGYGETPIFDCAKVWDALSDNLKKKLQTHGLQYQRFFPSRKSLFNFRKTWREAFQTEQRETVEDYLRSENMIFTWHHDGSLATKIHLPAVLHDTDRGKKYLSISMFNAESLIYNFHHFQDRYNPLMRKALEWFVHREYERGNTFLHIKLGDGTPFSRAECEEIQRAAWNHAIVFKWQTSDLMIMDNISFAHSRLNVKKPRQIITAMADKYDVRDYLSANQNVNYRLQDASQ
ncbi:MAG: TauD/TfdA family dioxygenase [Candidatus Thiodiazotropha sp.]|jgi:alpha-ketoglutarate-dependent taurine dioxygenase